jgi:hypothetical protein
MKRRSMIETSATLGLGALAGCALPGTAAQAPKTPFAVTDTYIPIVGIAEGGRGNKPFIGYAQSIDDLVLEDVLTRFEFLVGLKFANEVEDIITHNGQVTGAVYR